ncbi:hypothetical protein [Litorihabitans aurantiacus]|uniref:Uncharacterized protein n=1 Tax=Litorihabitans aurantiacus TaxID=1930061 RepID=A0AA37XGD9_9MICO|nr:hypothetical protein [Litorihabitans aurantiacus]GMA32360.1 hypothetical protein GCM10025875_23520 [Litorihabitans aurantiacus]
MSTSDRIGEISAMPARFRVGEVTGARAGIDRAADRGATRDVIEPRTDEDSRPRRAFVVGAVRDRLGEVHELRGRKRPRRRVRRAPRGLMDLELVANAYVDRAEVRAEQRQSLQRSADAVHEVAQRLRRQSEEPMLEGIQGDPARIAYLTLALHLRDTSEAISSSLEGLEVAEQAMQEASEEFRRIDGIELAPGHRSLLALGDPIAIPGVGTLAPAAAEKHWLGEIGDRQQSSAQAAMRRFSSEMARAAALMRPVDIPEIRSGPETPAPTPSTEPVPDVAPAQEAPVPASPATGGAAAGGAALAGGAGAARAAVARRFSGGGAARTAAARGPATPQERWVSTRHEHDTGPDGTMAPAATGSSGTAAAPAAAAGSTGAAAAGAAAAPMTPATGSGGQEEESGTAIVRTSQQDDEAAAAVVASSTATTGGRGRIEAAPAESEDW